MPGNSAKESDMEFLFHFTLAFFLKFPGFRPSPPPATSDSAYFSCFHHRLFGDYLQRNTDLSDGGGNPISGVG